MPHLSSESKTPISSNRKSVFLREWWLIEVDKDSRLGVGGFANRETLESRGMRIFGSASVGKRRNPNAFEAEIQVFNSAPIAKRLDNNTIETADGVTITISGCINRSRTLSYGFLPEVCDCFLSGFPCNWEEYAAKSSHGKCAKRSFPMSFEDLPVTRVRDMLMSTTGESEACAFTSIVFRDILKQCGGESHNQTAASVDSLTGSRNSNKIELDHEQDGVFLVNQTQKNDAAQKITAKAEVKTGISCWAGAVASPLSPVKIFDAFSEVVDPKCSSQPAGRHGEKGNSTTMIRSKRMASIEEQRDPLRSKRMKYHT